MSDYTHPDAGKRNPKSYSYYENRNHAAERQFGHCDPPNATIISKLGNEVLDIDSDVEECLMAIYRRFGLRYDVRFDGKLWSVKLDCWLGEHVQITHSGYEWNTRRDVLWDSLMKHDHARWMYVSDLERRLNS